MPRRIVVIEMTYINNNIKTSEILIDLPCSMTMYEMLGRIDQIRATGRYSEIRMDGTLNAIVGVI